MSAEILKKLAELERLLTASPTRRARVVTCTQAAFERLPGMVSRQEFMDWTGYDREELREAVKLGEIAVFRPKGHTKARYYKREIARLGGWKM